MEVECPHVEAVTILSPCCPAQSRPPLSSQRTPPVPAQLTTSLAPLTTHSLSTSSHCQLRLTQPHLLQDTDSHWVVLMPLYTVIHTPPSAHTLPFT